MSTNRYISTSFWDDEWIQTIDPSEKLLYLYFMTNPLTNIAGIYKVTERRISFDTGFTVSTIQHIMAKFETAGKAFRYGEWIILPTWTKHQRISDRDNNRKGIDAILKALPDDVFQYAVEKGYKYVYLDTLGRGLQGPSTTSNYLNLNLNLNLNSNLNVGTDSDESFSEVTPEPEPNELHEPPESQEKPIEPQAQVLASLLFTLHREGYDPGYKKTEAHLRTWARDIERIYRVDKRPWEEIEAVIRWCKADAFWFKNIMSGAKLKAQYDTLIAQMRHPPPRGRVVVDRSGGKSLPGQDDMPSWGKT